MGNEISTVFGAIATAATAVASAVTFGQVKSINNAVKSCAKYTGTTFMKTTVRHACETIGSGIATVGTAVAAGVTFGQVKKLNNAVVSCASRTAKSSKATAKTALETASDMLDGLPVVGHVKGLIHYRLGDKEGGDKAMKAASRTVGVIAGGVGGFLVGGSVGAVAGGIAGGAAMDGVITGVDSAVHGEYRPCGQIAAWTAVAQGKTAQDIVAGVVGGIATPALDALGGYAAGKSVSTQVRGKAVAAAEKSLESGMGAIKRNPNPALNDFLNRQKNIKAGNSAARSRGSVSSSTSSSSAATGKTAPRASITGAGGKAATSRGSSSSSTATGKTAPSTASTATGGPSTAPVRDSVTSRPSSAAAPNGKAVHRAPSTASTATGGPSTASGRGSVSSQSSSSSSASAASNVKAAPPAGTATGGASAAAAGSGSLPPQTIRDDEELGNADYPLRGQKFNHLTYPEYAPQPAIVYAPGPPRRPSFDHSVAKKEPTKVRRPPRRLQASTSGNQASASASGNPTSASTSGNQASASTSENQASASTSGNQASASTSGNQASVSTSGNEASASTSGNQASASFANVPPVSSSSSSALPPYFLQIYGISQADFTSAFHYSGNGVFQLNPNCSLAFTHAMTTTGDRPAAITNTGQFVPGRSAGELWRTCTGHAVTTYRCCVYNCPNRNCLPSSPQAARATAHVYATFQSSDHDISYMILIPTCSADNNWRQCINSSTNYPLTGQLANILYTITGAQLIFIRVDDRTSARKGAAGKGTGRGGGYHRKGGGKGGEGGPGNNGGPPPGANVINKCG
ncbi:hypothetical protein OS493_035697 [Desmophyllum pertusum]|uniref:Uncharacterized protein n=1 Tax=Desmophyllum pertusum TaxID=174260 RepID=A0A9X0CJT5_9CNID|nr:hypothetical protein OS493_035697 [Desmophyllum pertusum]